MKVAITGAAGYVGSLLVRAHAAHGDTVHATARNAAAIEDLPGVTRYGVDLTQPDRLPDAFFEHADVVYHCAAEIAREALMRAVNVDATRVLLARARGRVGHWVQVSSLSVYGTPRAGIVTERSEPRPRSLYAKTKLAADALVQAAAVDAFGYTLVRPSALLGPNMPHRSLHALIEAVDRGRFFFIGAPGAIGNYVHEDNVVSALQLCATRAAANGRTYNLSQNCSIERIVQTIAAAAGRRPPRGRLPEPLARLAAAISRAVPSFPLTPARVNALTSRVEYPSTRIEQELGYRHLQSIEDGLTTLVARWKGTQQAC